jgi:RNA polymerase sigma-70 factor (ECF subfamily)
MVAHLTRAFGPENIGLAEEVVQDALLKALREWPFHGVPDNPGGWLLRVAKNGALDALRRHSTLLRKEEEIRRTLDSTGEKDEPLFEREVRDDELRLIFLCCHPALGRDARVALSLKVACGFSVREIARAFLAEETAIAQRLVRAKRQLRETGAALELPRGAGLARRLDSVLEVIYLLFNEGYVAHAGENLVRFDLSEEALRLGLLVADFPETSAPRVHALVALMALQAARLPARVDDSGEMVLLEDQDRSRWDRRLLALGFRHFEKSAEGDAITEYHLQAAIAAVHARAAEGRATDWRQILDLYDQLLRLNPSPVVALNRVVALAKVEGAAVGLREIERLSEEPSLRSYHLLAAARGRLLLQIGERELAAESYREALRHPASEPERRFLLRQVAECDGPRARRK